MKCPKCSFVNRDGARFCLECGKKLECQCPSCKKELPLKAKFCDYCGSPISSDKSTVTEKINDIDINHSKRKGEQKLETAPIEGERKHVTALFSDLSGYTAMSERMDPEDVKDITSKLFDKISKIVRKYDGFVEKFVGDAVMALFGAKIAHEDDPVRAIKAALEIHNEVNKISPQYEEIIEQPLSMHTGINTGLVVTGEINLEKGTHGIAGDTLNVAARLSGIGNSGEIVVGQDTYNQSQGYFDFKSLESVTVKGKAESIQVYKVLSIKEQPKKIHRLQGARASLIGRKVEIQQLEEGIKKLQNNEGSAISICGTAGTGKSRLVEEFKTSLSLTNVQWFEGYAYPYAQNIPYFPLINLLNQAFQIKEEDSPDRVRDKIESGLSSIVHDAKEIIPYIGSLYSLDYPEIDEVSPEFWKSYLQKAVEAILTSLAEGGPTVVCLEDLHWADPSFIELFRYILSSFRHSVLFLCTYRPTITLLSSQQIAAMINPYKEIQVRDLSLSESQDMVESILDTETIPSELQFFIQNKVEGNPFYIEEIINSLIESKTLVNNNGAWKIVKEISDSDLSSTIHGVISSRLDRLENESKRILQEASVIGRAFYYEIIKKITDLNSGIDVHLSGLERLDFIKAKSFQPDVEYIFKHALTQEIVYSGLLKKERQLIHERTGLVMEQLFHDRLPEFCETLAFHFKRSNSAIKAVEYLIKSGEKSLKRYSLEESDSYYFEAYEILLSIENETEEIKETLIDLLNKWAFVFYYRGNFKGLGELLSKHEKMAESISNKENLGMFYAWQGNANWIRAKFKKSNDYFFKAISLGENSGSKRVVGYAKTWLSWVCAEQGLFNEGIKYGNEANKIAKELKSDHYLFFKSLGGIGYNYAYMGAVDSCLQIGEDLIKYGNEHSHIRSLVLGYTFKGTGKANYGDNKSAIELHSMARQVASDPFYEAYPSGWLAFLYMLEGNLIESRKHAEYLKSFSDKNGCENYGSMMKVIFGGLLIGEGKMSKGMKMIENSLQTFYVGERKMSIALCEYIIGRIYLEIVKGGEPISPMTIVKNLGFIIKHVPSAAKRAEEQLNKALDFMVEINAAGYVGLIQLDLGILLMNKKRYNESKQHIRKAITIFEELGALYLLNRSKDALEAVP